MVQWLRLCTPNAAGPSSIPGQGARYHLEQLKFPHVCSVVQPCLTLRDSMNCNSPGSSVHGIFQARILEWVAISYSRGSSWPRNWTHISCTGRQILYHWDTWEASHASMEINKYISSYHLKKKKKDFYHWSWCSQEASKWRPYISRSYFYCCSVTQSCPTLCNDPMNCSPPGSSVHGILQARILEWVAISFSRGSSQTRRSNPCLLHWQTGLQFAVCKWEVQRGEVCLPFTPTIDHVYKFSDCCFRTCIVQTLSLS